MLGSHVGSEHPEEFLGPYAIYSIQAFTRAIKDDTIADLGLTIALRIVESGDPIGDHVFRTKVSHLLVGKVYPIVRDNCMGKSKATHDVLPKKLDSLLTSNFGEWHHFDPFGEVIGGY